MTSSLSFGHGNASSRSLLMRVLPSLRARVLAVIGLAVIALFGFFAIEGGSRHGAASQATSALRTGRGLSGIDDGLPPPTAVEFAALREDVAAIARSIDMRSTDATVISLTRQLEDVVRTVASLQESVQSLDDNTSKLTQMVLVLKEQQPAPRIEERQNSEAQTQLLELSASAADMKKHVASMSTTLLSIETNQADHSDELKALTGRVGALETLSVTLREDMERVSMRLASIATDVSIARQVEPRPHAGTQAATGKEHIGDTKFRSEDVSANEAHGEDAKRLQNVAELQADPPQTDRNMLSGAQIAGEERSRPVRGPEPGRHRDTATRGDGTRNDIAKVVGDEQVAGAAPETKADGHVDHRQPPPPQTAEDVRASAQEQAETPKRHQLLGSQDRDQEALAGAEPFGNGAAGVPDLPGSEHGPKLAADRESTIEPPVAPAQRSVRREVPVQQQDQPGLETEKAADKGRAHAATQGDAASPAKPPASRQEVILSQNEKSAPDGGNGVRQPRALDSDAAAQAADTTTPGKLSRYSQAAAGIQQAAQANAVLDGDVQPQHQEERSNRGVAAANGNAAPEAANELHAMNEPASRASGEHEGEQASGGELAAGKERSDNADSGKHPSHADAGGNPASAAEAEGMMPMPEVERGVTKRAADRDADNVGAAAMPEDKVPAVVDNVEEAEHELESNDRGGNDQAGVPLAGDLERIDSARVEAPPPPAPPRPRFVR